MKWVPNGCLWGLQKTRTNKPSAVSGTFTTEKSLLMFEVWLFDLQDQLFSFRIFKENSYFSIGQKALRVKG
jgi:hypothetical protein